MFSYTKVNILLVVLWLLTGRRRRLGQTLWLNSVAIVILFDGALKVKYPGVRRQVMAENGAGRPDLVAHYLPLLMLPRPGSPRPVHLLAPYLMNVLWGASLDWDLEKAYGSAMSEEVSRKMWPWMGMAHILAGVTAGGLTGATGGQVGAFARRSIAKLQTVS